MTEDEKLAKRRVQNRESYQRNRRKRLEKHRLWRAQNPERAKALNKRWYHENRERALVARRKYRKANREKMRLLLKAWYVRNREKIADKHRLVSTGCTPEQYKELIKAQNGVCAICQRRPGRSKLAADHCHSTDVIRGLLCFACNTMLGLAGDSPERLRTAVVYLEKFPVVTA